MDDVVQWAKTAALADAAEREAFIVHHEQKTPAYGATLRRWLEQVPGQREQPVAIEYCGEVGVTSWCVPSGYVPVGSFGGSRVSSEWNAGRIHSGECSHFALVNPVTGHCAILSATLTGENGAVMLHTVTPIGPDVSMSAGPRRYTYHHDASAVPAVPGEHKADVAFAEGTVLHSVGFSAAKAGHAMESFEAAWGTKTFEDVRRAEAVGGETPVSIAGQGEPDRQLSPYALHVAKALANSIPRAGLPVPSSLDEATALAAAKIDAERMPQSIAFWPGEPSGQLDTSAFVPISVADISDRIGVPFSVGYCHAPAACAVIVLRPKVPGISSVEACIRSAVAGFDVANARKIK